MEAYTTETLARTILDHGIRIEVGTGRSAYGVTVRHDSTLKHLGQAMKFFGLGLASDGKILRRAICKAIIADYDAGKVR